MMWGLTPFFGGNPCSSMTPVLSHNFQAFSWAFPNELCCFAGRKGSEHEKQKAEYSPETGSW